MGHSPPMWSSGCLGGATPSDERRRDAVEVTAGGCGCLTASVCEAGFEHRGYGRSGLRWGCLEYAEGWMPLVHTLHTGETQCCESLPILAFVPHPRLCLACLSQS